ncbi:MAG: hypothetical protein KC646_00960 [Candidatus Cloacimonetes bacterium]|nr:hypothetical protein [Candidatus Cloacimonadota bacterium]
MYKKFETTIVTIVLEEVYADGFIEAYEREALKKVLKKVGINRDVFQNIHKKIAIEAKKKSLEPKLDDQGGFLMRVCDRLTESTTSEIAQEIISLLAEEFQLDIPTQTDTEPNKNTSDITEQSSLPSEDNSNDQSPKISTFETSEREIVPSSFGTPDIALESPKITTKSRQKLTQPKKSIGAKKKKNIPNDQGTLKVSSPNYGLACYLLGNGSLSWICVFSLMAILINLNVHELYTQHRYLKKTTTKVVGTVLGSMFARNALFDLEIVEVHYHYIKDGKNFTGYSYTLDTYKRADSKVTVMVNITNPKLSRLKDGSYYEYDVIVFVPILALFFFLFTAVYGTLKAKHTPVSELNMIGQDLKSILSHFCIRRLSILLITIFYCSFFSVGDLVFNILVPIFNMIFIFALIVLAIIGSLYADS